MDTTFRLHWSTASRWKHVWPLLLQHCYGIPGFTLEQQYNHYLEHTNHPQQVMYLKDGVV